MMMMIPEAWESNALMDRDRRAFYEYHAAMMEPWDGPAAIAFTDGRQIGATLDRNGLRPARYIVTDDDLVVMASEVGVLPMPEDEHRQEVAPAAGQDVPRRPRAGRIIDDEELKETLAIAKPYREWIERIRLRLDEMPEPAPARRLVGAAARSPAGVRLHAGRPQVPDRADGAERRGADRLDGQRLAAGGAVDQEQDALQLLQAAVRAGHEPADRPDPRGARDVAGVVHRPEAEPARARSRDEDAEDRRRRERTGDDIRRRPAAAPRGAAAGARLREHGEAAPHRALHRRASSAPSSSTSPIRRLGQRGDRGARSRASRAQAEDAIRSGYNIIICRDRMHRPRQVAIPALLALSAMHQHLVEKGLRTSAGLVVETGSAREVHHFALLAGYGAEAVHPYLALETPALDMLGTRRRELRRGSQWRSRERGESKNRRSYVKAIGKGLSKVMSKMGMSTYMSYCGAQIFEAVGLHEGAGRQVLHRHREHGRGHRRVRGRRGRRSAARAAFGDDPVLAACARRRRRIPGACAARSTCGRPTRSRSCSTRRARTRYATYKEYAQIINDQVAGT